MRMRFGSVNPITHEREAYDRPAEIVALDFEPMAIPIQQFQPRPSVEQSRPCVQDLRLIFQSGVRHPKAVMIVELSRDYDCDMAAIDRRRDAMFDRVFDQGL